MKPIDHIAPSLPSHLVRRPEGKDERRESVPGRRRKPRPKLPTGHKPGEPGHIVDELA